MKFAAIDVGSNSVHTLVVDVDSDGSFTPLDSEREMVMLARDLTPEGLSPRGFTEGLSAIRRACRLARSHEVEEIRAVCTSAVRDSENGGEFMAKAARDCKLNIRTISGQEEARLVYLAVRESIDLQQGRCLIVDIGGGSVEFIVTRAGRMRHVETARLGVLRLLQRFPIGNPPDPEALAKMDRYLRANLKPVFARLKIEGYDHVVFTSGTALSLLGIAMGREALSSEDLHNLEVPRDKLVETAKAVVVMPRAERRAIPDLDPGRVDSIVSGAVLCRAILRGLKPPAVIACSRALREGLVLDAIQTEPELFGLDTPRNEASIRRRSVIGTVHRGGVVERHVAHTADLAVELFDHLILLHNLGPKWRELLYFGTWLHEIGYVISSRAHHRHGQYIVLNADLLGFTDREIQILGLMARYHRKKGPTTQDPAFVALKPSGRQAFLWILGILRVADGLDRTHAALVESIDCEVTDSLLKVVARSNADIEVELLAALRKADVLAEASARTIEIVSAPPREEATFAKLQKK